MDKILLLGSNGMLGQAIYKKLKDEKYEIHCVNRRNSEYCFNLVNDERLRKCIVEVQPDIIINTAAIVNLEMCEGNYGEAYCINSRVPGILSEICCLYDIYFVQVSTDHYYVCDGNRMHGENENVSLVNEYARTKYIGEQLALMHENTLVLRTNVVGFRGYGQPTFIEWAINEIEKNDKMSLFTDFYTSSMHTNDFSNVLCDILPKRPTGIYNLSSSTVTNKRDFVIGLSEAIYGRIPVYEEATVKSIGGAMRAESLGLDTKKIEALVGYKMPSFTDTIISIKNEYEERKRKHEI